MSLIPSRCVLEKSNCLILHRIAHGSTHGWDKWFLSCSPSRPRICARTGHFRPAAVQLHLSSVEARSRTFFWLPKRGSLTNTSTSSRLVNLIVVTPWSLGRRRFTAMPNDGEDLSRSDEWYVPPHHPSPNPSNPLIRCPLPTPFRLPHG